MIGAGVVNQKTFTRFRFFGFKTYIRAVVADDGDAVAVFVGGAFSTTIGE